MKRIYLWAILPLCVACSNETPQAATAALEIRHAARLVTPQPGNPENAFDAVGRLHNAITDAWLTGENLPLSLEAILSDVEELATREGEFLQLAGEDYIPPPAALLQDIIDGQELAVEQTIANAGMSEQASESLTGFIGHIMELDEAGSQYDSIYRYVVEYERHVIGQDFSSLDKKTILLTASIARHASYLAKTRKRKPRDRDWDLVIANIVAATEGARQGTARAIIMAATVGIFSNYQDDAL